MMTTGQGGPLHSQEDKILTSLVTLLNVTGPCLDRRALASVVEAVARPAALLNSIATCYGTGGPL